MFPQRWWLVRISVVIAAAFSLLLLLLLPSQAFAAEVLQVRSATLLQVGDRNRNYSVQLACVEVAPDDEQQAQDWLRRAVPRRRRVNLRPEGSSDGVLLARVTPIGDELDLGAALVQEGLARVSCPAA